MQKRNEIDLKNKITVDINELQTILSVGRNTASRIGEDAQAVVRIGRRKLYNVEKIKKYMEDQSNERKTE